MLGAMAVCPNNCADKCYLSLLDVVWPDTREACAVWPLYVNGGREAPNIIIILSDVIDHVHALVGSTKYFFPVVFKIFTQRIMYSSHNT